jgi:sugar/nucleoside kinase (ribokinase family)
VTEPLDLLVLGDVNPDLVLEGEIEPAFGQVERLVDDARLTIGGSAAIVAAGAARLGLRVGLCGIVGDDLFGRFLLDELVARGVDVRGLVADADGPTGLTVVLARPEDRAILTHAGTIADLTVDRIDPAHLADARHVHVGSFFLQPRLAPGLPSLFEQVRARGGTTSIDPNWDPAERWDGGLHAVLPHTDVFLPNANEAMRIAGEESPDQAGLVLAREAGLVVIKAGRNGTVATDGGRVVRADAPAIDAVDTTGAGDAFDAGFLASWLAGDPIERSLALANACGALSTRALGAVDGQATMAEALALVEGTPSGEPSR